MRHRVMRRRVRFLAARLRVKRSTPATLATTVSNVRTFKGSESLHTAFRCGQRLPRGRSFKGSESLHAAFRSFKGSESLHTAF